MKMGANVGPGDVERMTSKLYIASGEDRARKWSSFWVLLVLASIIATTGVVSDSTATVIGAMIVAPLMIPILGTALALVLTDRRQLLINAGLIVAGALTVVLVGYLLGRLHPGAITAATNSQVAGRVSPRLIDLTAALATGLVGAFALVRSDISDTLPGVAIAISLVPPLAVVGLTLESGAPNEALGALLLFGTNVAAILATGTLLLIVFGVNRVARESGLATGNPSRTTLLVVAGFVVLVSIPLGIGSLGVAKQQAILNRATPVAEEWATGQGWSVKDITFRQGVLRVVALGSLPEADPEDLRQALDDAGLEDVEAQVTLVVGGSKDLPVIQQ